eukprot:1161080-Pelagomonas_calceolata.AAC.15
MAAWPLLKAAISYTGSYTGVVVVARDCCAAAGRGTAANWYRGQHPLQTVRDTLEACSVLGKGHERCVAIHG